MDFNLTLSLIIAFGMFFNGFGLGAFVKETVLRNKYDFVPKATPPSA